MAVRLYSEFKSDNGTQYKIEIHDANWLAVATTFNVDSRGFELTYEGETDDIVSPIVSSRLQFGAYSANGTFETFVNTLKTFQENRFQIAVYKYNGTSYDLYWAGWLLQDLVSVEDSSQPYIYEMTAIDGLGRLANVEYTSANTIIQTNGLQVSRVTDVIKTALNNIGTANLWGSSDVFFETSADWWETNAQTYSTSVDPVNNQGFDVRYFQERDDNGDVVYPSTLEILRQVATLYNGRFYMQNGRFVFEQYGNRDTSSRYVSRYTKTGTAISRTSVSDDVTINQTIYAARTSGNNWNFLPAAQRAKIHYIQRFLNPFNAFSQYRFRNTTNAFTAGFIAGGSGVQLALGSTQFNFRVVGASSPTSPIFPVFKMRIRIQDSSTGTFYYYNRTYNGVAAGGAMFGIASWSTTAGEYFFDLPPFFTSGVSIVKYPVQIITDDIPVNGEIDFRLQLHGVFRSKNGATYTPTQPAVFDSIFVFGIQTNGASNAPGATFSSTNTETGIDSQLTIDLGDLVIADGPFQSGHLAAYNGSTWVGTQDWRKGSSGTALPILKLLTNETLALHVRPIEQYNGTFILSALFGQRLLFNSAAYLMTSGTFTANNDEWSATLYKIETIRASVTPIDPIDDLAERTELIGTTTTNGTSPNDIIGGRIGGMVVDIEDEKIGPFQQTETGARINGTMNVTGDVTLDAGLDVDGVSHFNNDVNITGSVTSTGPLTGEYIQLDTDYNTTPTAGQIVWSTDDGTIDVGLNTNVVLQVGQELHWYVKNQTGSTIPNGTAVRAVGTLGASGRILVAPMVADGSVPARFFLGIATEDIANGGEGYVTSFGKVRGLDTSGYTEGAVLWCNPSVAGGLTTTEPSAPNLKLAVAFVINVHANNGTLAVRAETGVKIADASDVQVTSVADNDLLQYNTTTSRWENVAGTTTNIGEGTNLYYTNARARAAVSETIDGISYNNTTGVFSLDAGRVIVTTTQTGQWDTAYNDRIVSAAVAGTTTKTLTLTQGDGGTITASWTDYDTAPVTSVNGQTGVVVLTTDNIGEGTSNLYFTNARARAALSAGTGITYDNGTGVITNAAPDQVVALTASTGVGITGTYPNFTIENTAPDQVVALTASTGISITGTYPNFTIENTSPSSGGTITGSGTTNYLSKWTSGSALGDSVIYDDGTNVGIGTASPTAKLHVEGGGGTGLGNTDIVSLFKRTTTNGNSYIGIDTITEDRDSGIRFGDGGTNRWTLLSYRSAATDGFAFYNHTANNFSVFIDNSSNVGIGTTSPGAKLHVDGQALVTGTITTSNGTLGTVHFVGSSYKIEGGSNVGDLRYTAPRHRWYEDTNFVMTIDGGNVGIGTTSPSSTLHVSGTIRVNNIIGETYPSNTFIDFDYDETAWTNSLALGSIGSVFYLADTNNNSASTTPAHQFFTGTTDIDTATALMTIRTDGNVGIGTDSPGKKLEVREESGTESSIRIRQLSYNYWDLKSPASNTSFTIGDVGGEKMRITAGGNVGIGTTSPSNKLQVTGTGRVFNAISTNDEVVASLTCSSGNISTIGFNGTGSSSDYHVRIGANATSLVSYTNNAERMRITSGGNVGIGTTSPDAKIHLTGEFETNYALQISGTYGTGRTFGWKTNGGNSDVLSLYDVNSTNRMAFFGNNEVGLQTQGSVRLYINSTGNVGIGTTAPGAKLHVVGGLARVEGTETDQYFFEGIRTGTSTTLRIYDNSSNLYYDSYGTMVFRANQNGGSGGYIGFFGGNVGIGTTAPQSILDVTQSTPTISITSTIPIELTTDNQTLSQFIFYKHYGLAQGAKIAMLQSGGIYSYPQAHLAFFTNDGSGGWSAPSERMRIKDNGNVGIGTTSPGTELQVSGDLTIGKTGTDGRMLFTRPSDGATAAMFGYFSAANDDFGIENGSGGGNIKFKSNAGIFQFSNTASSELMRITSAGNVGIGTTSPSAKLHVIGGRILVQDGSNAGLMINTGGVNRYSVASTSGAFQIFDEVASTNRFYITSGGNVGIGTTSPNTKLRIVDSISSPPLSIQNTNADGYSGSWLYNSAGTLVGHFGWANGSTTALSDKMYFGTIANKDVVFTTNDTEKVRITAGGNVGIGTTSPSVKLHVVGSEYIQGGFLYMDNAFPIVWGSSVSVEGNTTTNSLAIKTSASTRVFVNSSGNVGINTTSPTHKLHVAADVRMDAADNPPQYNYFESNINYAYGAEGANEIVLGKPDIWLRINVDGVDYVFPGYNVTA